MRLKFRQDDIDVIIAVTNVHYCKHADDEWNDKEGLSVLQQDMPQNIGMMFVGISSLARKEYVMQFLSQLLQISLIQTIVKAHLRFWMLWE